MANKKKRQMDKEDKRWVERYGHLTTHTKWDSKKRTCDKCILPDKSKAPLGVNTQTNRLFCSNCFCDMGEA